MGRAVVRRPRVFLFDEPLSNLDASLRAQMRVELKRLHQRLGATMIYVTHDQIEAMTLADRIAVLRAGALVQVGAPAELYARPRDLFVGRFIGTPELNVVPAAAALALGLTDAAPAGAVELGIRVEDLELGAAGAAAVVEVIEPLGWEALVHLALGGLRLTARAEVARAPAPGAAGRVSARAGRVHGFDARGERVAERAP
jgi:multiple sugar transport system ATP-binding protein